jgi:hypothetical protein
MSPNTMVPQHLADSLLHGVKLAVSVLDFGEASYEGKDLHRMAQEWEVTLPGHLRVGLTPVKAAALHAVLAEAAEYALTCNYGAEEDKKDFPEDYLFAQQADEILAFLQTASIVAFA